MPVESPCGPWSLGWALLGPGQLNAPAGPCPADLGEDQTVAQPVRPLGGLFAIIIFPFSGGGRRLRAACGCSLLCAERRPRPLAVFRVPHGGLR